MHAVTSFWWLRMQSLLQVEKLMLVASIQHACSNDNQLPLLQGVCASQDGHSALYLQQLLVCALRLAGTALLPAG
jgi:hypothetical protein